MDYKYILTQSWAVPIQNFNPEHWPVGCIGNLNTTHTQTHFEVSFDPALLPSCLLITLCFSASLFEQTAEIGAGDKRRARNSFRAKFSALAPHSLNVDGGECVRAR